jgi:molybdenum cofactor guanylyltransferase
MNRSNKPLKSTSSTAENVTPPQWRKNSGHDQTSRVAGIVLAGGLSRRMGGVNKALLKVGGRCIVERVTDTLRSIFPEVLIITNTPEDFQFLGLPMFSDLRPGKGALGGLYTGLSVCPRDYGFFAACDLPFMDQQTILHMVSLIEDYDVVVPRISNGWEPLHALYSPRCLPYIEEMLSDGDLKIFHFFHKVKLREVPEHDLRRFDPRLLFTINLNTPADLERARSIAEEYTGGNSDE